MFNVLNPHARRRRAAIGEKEEFMVSEHNTRSAEFLAEMAMKFIARSLQCVHLAVPGTYVLCEWLIVMKGPVGMLIGMKRYLSGTA